MPLMLGPRSEGLLRAGSRGSGASLRGRRRARPSQGSQNIVLNQLALSQLSLSRKRTPSPTSVSSLRRQKSSRQSALLDFLRLGEEPAASGQKNAEWSQLRAPDAPKKNAMLSLLDRTPAASAVPPPAAGLPPPSGAATDALREKFGLHGPSSLWKSQLARRPPQPAGATTPARRGLHDLRRARRHTFHRIEEEDGWGHFVEITSGAEQDVPARHFVGASRAASLVRLDPARGARPTSILKC